MRLILCDQKTCSKSKINDIVKQRFPNNECKISIDDESNVYIVDVDDGSTEENRHISRELRSACRHLPDQEPNPPRNFSVNEGSRNLIANTIMKGSVYDEPDEIEQAPTTQKASQTISLDKADNMRIIFETKYEERDLKAQLKSLFVNAACVKVPTIHSMAPYSIDQSHATVSFPPNTKREELQALIDNDPGNLAGDFGLEYSFDFYGITVLYDGSRITDQPIIDIVAIPGLGTNAFGTFRAPKGDRMWLRDFIKIDAPYVRVLLYGYDSKVDNSSTDQTLLEIAQTCAGRLSDFREETRTEDRPIIWLGQSLGGLIIYAMLCWLEGNNKNRILKSTIGLITYGAPLAGLNNPALLATVTDKCNEALVRSICLENGNPSLYLIDLKRRFTELKGKSQFRMNGFYETKLSRSKRALEGPAVRHTIPVEGLDEEKAYSLKDHSELVKFPKRDDEDYKHTISIIRNRYRTWRDENNI